MDEEAHKKFVLTDRSYSALIKKGIKDITSEIKFSAAKAGKIDIIVSELLTNLIKHTSKGGEILVKILQNEDSKGVEIISLDSGPGIKEVKKMAADGFSTVGTLGHGLGSIIRLSDEFDIYSLPGWGTVLLSRIWEKKLPAKTAAKYEIGSVMTAKTGEEKCGDGWVSFQTHRKLKIAVFDGLGHGPQAHEAAKAAINAFKTNISLLPDSLIYSTHNSIRKTRGVVGFIMDIDKTKNTCIYTGVGNISTKCYSRNSSKNLISYNGTIGYIIPGSIANHSAELKDFDLVVIHSDGVKTYWEPEKHPGIFNHHPATIAACIYNDQHRGTDDAAIIVVKINRKIS
jgi:anti-sigma regulatory factor (Ser/Thr protein kinase)